MFSLVRLSLVNVAFSALVQPSWLEIIFIWSYTPPSSPLTLLLTLYCLHNLPTLYICT